MRISMSTSYSECELFAIHLLEYFELLTHLMLTQKTSLVARIAASVGHASAIGVTPCALRPAI